MLKTLEDTCADHVPHPIALQSLLSLEVHRRRALDTHLTVSLTHLTVVF